MDRGKMSSAGRGAKSKAPQHPQDIFALGSKSTVAVTRDSEKRNIHKPSTSGVERKRETTGFGSAPPSKRARIESPAESVVGTSLEVDPVDLVPNVLQALDTLNSDKLLGLLTGSIRLLKSQRAKPDPILCMSMLYLCKIRPNMFAHDTVTQMLCTLLKREQGAAFKNKGNPLVFVLACNMLYAGHRESNNWPDTFIKVYIEDALNERWWVECSWCKCLVDNIVTAFGTKQPPQHLIPTESTLGTMSPSGSGSPLMGSTEDDTADTDLEYSVFPRYSSSYETVEALVLEAIKDQIQRRAAPDAIGKGFLKLLSATCGFPEIRMISASRLEAWLHSGKLWRAAQELLACVCCNADCAGPCAARDHEVLAVLARMRLKTKPLQHAYQACLREMVSESPALLRSVVTHTIYNELSTTRSPHNMAVLAALVAAQATLVPAAMADTYLELVLRPEDYLRPLRALTRECVRGGRADVAALLPLARALAQPPPHDPPNEIRERAFSSIADLFCVCCLLTAAHSKQAEPRQQLAAIQAAALAWLLDTAPRAYRPPRLLYQLALNKIMFLEPAETYSKPDNWPPESERAFTYRLCCEAPLPQSTLLRIIYIGLSKDIPVAPAEIMELIESVVRRAVAAGVAPDEGPAEKIDLADFIFQLTQFNPPDNITLPAGYSPPPLAITSLYWRAWLLLVTLCAQNAATFSPTYPTLTCLIDTCITGKPSVEWNTVETERLEAERAAILQLEGHLAASSGNKLPITEHNSRLLSQLTTLDPLGPARKPPPSVLEQLQQLNQQLKLGKLLCRQPALLLELVERHGTRRAMPWLHQLLTHDQLQLSVLPVQCLCEFLSAGGGAGGGVGGARGAALAAHVRRVLHDTEQGAACVLAYYAHRLAHAMPATRHTARTGLKLVLSQTEDTEVDYNADVSPDEWMDLLWDLRHWESVRETFIGHIRAACQVECIPRHVASYIKLLDKYLTLTPDPPLARVALELSQVVMERLTVMSAILPAPEPRTQEPVQLQHRTLHCLTNIFYSYMQKVISEGVKEEEESGEGMEKVVVQWASGRRALVHLVVAHANLKLLCCGPSIYDTNQEMYTYLQSLWVGGDQPQAFSLDGGEEVDLLPDWLRLHLVRSARPPLLEAGLRGLPAHKLALFIQTFGMPVASMSALLGALDASPAGAVARVGVERGYMWQLLAVQRARGARGGGAFAAALGLQPDPHLPDEKLFSEEPLPAEPEPAQQPPPTLPPDAVPALLASVFGQARSFHGDLDTAFIMLISKVTEEASEMSSNPLLKGRYVESVLSHLQLAVTGPAAAALLRRPAHAAPLLRALLPLAATPRLQEIASLLLRQYKLATGPVVRALSALAARADHKPEPADVRLPAAPTRDQLVTILESCTPRNLELVGHRIIESQEPQLVVDAISAILENNQQQKYDVNVKSEDGIEVPGHVFSQKALGCGLLLDWISELQRETAGPHEKLMKVMFSGRRAGWRALLVTLLAHRASPRTLHRTLASLLQPHRDWDPTAVLDFAETLLSSPRVWQGRDRNVPKHQQPSDSLHLSHTQLHVLVRYVCLERSRLEAGGGGSEGGAEVGTEGGTEARLGLVLRCCTSAPSLLCAALAADPDLLNMLYMKVPKIQQLLSECSVRPVQCAVAGAGAGAGGLAACDRVSHTLLTALAAPDYTKEHSLKWARVEGAVRALWRRAGGAGGRALGLAAALLRGAPRSTRQRPHHHLLAAIEMLPDHYLFHNDNVEEIHNILECYVGLLRTAGSSGGRDNTLAHRVAALLRRYVASRPASAAQILQIVRESPNCAPALAAVSAAEVSAAASAAPPRPALLVLQRRAAPAHELVYALQEVEAWGARRGGAWGGWEAARALLAAAAPLAASSDPQLRHHALQLLPKLLPAVADTTPGLQTVLQCLDSQQPEVAQAAVDKVPELLVAMPEHAHQILLKVFTLGIQSRHPVEQCISKCVSTFNAHRGC